METTEINYDRIAKAITYIREHFREQPDLENIANEVHLSPFHFQRIFKEWAGTTPKKFLQYLTVEHAKKLLKENQATLSDVTNETGLSGTGRLHDLFINIEGMTPAEYKHGGKNLAINYSLAESPFGNIPFRFDLSPRLRWSSATPSLPVIAKRISAARKWEQSHPSMERSWGTLRQRGSSRRPASCGSMKK